MFVSFSSCCSFISPCLLIICVFSHLLVYYFHQTCYNISLANIKTSFAFFPAINFHSPQPFNTPTLFTPFCYFIFIFIKCASPIESVTTSAISCHNSCHIISINFYYFLSTTSRISPTSPLPPSPPSPHSSTTTTATPPPNYSSPPPTSSYTPLCDFLLAILNCIKNKLSVISLCLFLSCNISTNEHFLSIFCTLSLLLCKSLW